MNNKEARSEKFKRIATKRTNDILNKIRILGNCSNKSSYNYTSDEVSKIFNTIERATKEAKSNFHFSKGGDFKL